MLEITRNVLLYALSASSFSMGKGNFEAKISFLQRFGYKWRRGEGWQKNKVKTEMGLGLLMGENLAVTW